MLRSEEIGVSEKKRGGTEQKYLKNNGPLLVLSLSLERKKKNGQNISRYDENYTPPRSEKPNTH